MISKELLSKVLKVEVCSVSSFLRKEELEYQFVSSRNEEYGENHAFNEIIYPPRRINVYELVHKCTLWLSSKTNFQIQYFTGGGVYLYFPISGKDFEGSVDETVFEACEWFLKELKKDEK